MVELVLPFSLHNSSSSFLKLKNQIITTPICIKVAFSIVLILKMIFCPEKNKLSVQIQESIMYQSSFKQEAQMPSQLAKWWKKW